MGSSYGMIGGNDPSSAEEMAIRLSHRGSAKRVFALPAGGFLAGHSEDCESQPWSFGRFVMVGEIDLYDPEGLIRLLSDHGHQSQAADGGQLLLEAWAIIGSNGLRHANGDFAVAIADLDSGEMHLVRDRSGTRPMYYTGISNQWFFASEYKALLAVPDMVREIDLGALHTLHTRKVVPASRTLMKGVLQVPAQSVVTLGKNGHASVDRYWQASGNVGRSDFAWHKDCVASAFLRAVDRRTANAERLGISVSGGVDSIAMVAAVRKVNPDAEIRTYTIGDSADDPEVTVARRVADYYGTDHHEQVFSTENLAARMRHLVWGLEDPIARTETLMTYDVCASAQSQVDIMLRGDGADGLFGGMSRHKILALAERTQRIPLAASTLSDVYSFTQTGNLPTNLVSRILVKTYFRSKIPQPPVVNGFLGEKSGSDLCSSREVSLNSTLLKGHEHALPMLLQKVERPHALFHMRSVSPFLDNDLVDCAHRVPSLFKNDGRRGKIVFREAVTQFLPTEFSRLPKYAQRVRETQEFCDVLDDVVIGERIMKSLVDRQLFHKNELASLFARPANGIWAPEHAMRVWTLILTEFWLRLFLDSGGKR